MMAYLKHAGVPFSRLHDVGGRFGGDEKYEGLPNHSILWNGNCQTIVYYGMVIDFRTVF